MAEALSVAASGIAIAQVTSQVGIAIVKLKQLLDKVKDVPDEIADLMQQIDCLDPALFEAENSFNDTALPSILWDDLAAKRSTTYCRNALKALTELVDELSLQINNPRKFNRKIASVRVVLEMDILKKLEKRLENAVRMLSLAQNGYLVALTRIQPDIIIHKFTALTAHLKPSHNISPTSAQADNDNGLKGDNSKAGKLNQPQIVQSVLFHQRQSSMHLSPFGRFAINVSDQGFDIMMQTPSWLCRRSWDLQGLRAHGSWQINLRSYCARPPDSEVFLVARRGSPQDLQRMFDMGLASPFDYNGYNGKTLLHVASQSKDPTLIPYLLNKGVDLTRADYLGRTAIHHLIFVSVIERNMALLENSIFVDSITATLEVDHLNRDEDSKRSCNCAMGFNGPEAYMLLQPHICPSHNHTTIESRLKAAKRACNPRVLKMILEPEWTTDLVNLYRISTIIGIDLLQVVLRHTWIDYKLYLDGHGSLLNAGKHWCEWFKLSTEIMTRIPETFLIIRGLLQRKDTSCTFVLSGLLENIRPNRRLRAWNTHAAILLRSWVMSLYNAGIDLVEFGRLERQILHDERLGLTRHFYLCKKYYERDPRRIQTRAWKGVSIYLIGFKYRPEPKDWDIYWSEPTDEFAGDFWKLIEEPPPHIPGAWDDSFDD